MLEIVKKIFNNKHNHPFLYLPVEKYKTYKHLIFILLYFTKKYNRCLIYRKKVNYTKNVVVFALRNYGENLKRRTTKFAKGFVGKPCPFCLVKLTNENATTDHIVPISKRGTNAKINLVAVCEKCNQERANTDFNDFLIYKRGKIIFL